jgi:hypothetical protein
VLSLGYVEPVRVCDVCHEHCALRDAFLEVVRNGDVRATHAMLQHQHVGADDTTATQTPLLIAASKGDATDIFICLSLLFFLTSSSVLAAHLLLLVSSFAPLTLKGCRVAACWLRHRQATRK